MDVHAAPGGRRVCEPPPQPPARPWNIASSNPWRGTSIAPAELQPSVFGSRANWSLMAVSPASCPPRITALPSSSVVAPAPLVGRGRSGKRTQAELSKLKQSTRVVADAWSRPSGRGGPTLHALPSNTQTVRRLLPAASNPPITYSLPPALAAAASSSATGKEASARWAGGGGGDGEGDGDATTGLGLGGGAADGVAAACSCGAAHETITSETRTPARKPQLKTQTDRDH